MASPASLLLVLSSLFSQTIESARPNYFRFDDCADGCKTLNISCTIERSSINDFQSFCHSDPSVCADEATALVVCLRPNLPPIGGETVWLEFRDKRYPNLPPNVIPDNGLLHLVLAAVGALIALAIFLLITVLCMMSESRTGYEQFANPSPGPLVDNPYAATVEQLSPA